MGDQYIKKFWKLAATAAAASLIVAACGGSDSATDTTVASGGKSDLKVAVVYIGPKEDKGWTYQHDQGIIDLEEQLGVEVKRVESIPDDEASEATFEQLAEEGYNLIFATSFGYGKPLSRVAAKNPGVCFQWATGADFLLTKAEGGAFDDVASIPANIGYYFGAAEEARYLSGIAAGKATKVAKIGYVAAYPIPEVIRGINAFTLGVRSVNADAEVQVTWTKTWFNPTLEKQAAESLLAAGADVLAMHQDTTETGVAAQAKGAKWVGYNSDVAEAAPEAWLTAPTWDWGPFYVKTAKAVQAAKAADPDSCPKSEATYGNMSDGMVTLGSFGKSVTAETKALIEDKQAAIIDGSFAPFTGPINKQDGSAWLKDGEKADLGFLLGQMTFFVEGVVGSDKG
jgi:basic membrane protein A